MIREYGEPTLIIFAIIAGLWGACKVVWPRALRWFWGAVEIGQALTMMPQAVQSLSHMNAMQSTMTKILAEVRPNGGSSLRDSVTRQEKMLQEVCNEVSLLTGTFRANADADPDKAMFECDSFGENIWVNRTYCEWVNRSEKDLLGWGFLNIVIHEDREMVRNDWFAAMGERRQYSCRHSIYDGQGGIVLVDVTATPIPEGGEPQRWIGVIRRVKQ